MGFETNKFDVSKKIRLEKTTFNVECNLETNVEIDKILSVCHTAEPENIEVLNGVINYTGVLDVCLIYLTVDGEIGTINSACPFSSKFESGEIQVGDKAFIKVEVEDYSVENITSSNIKLGCTCEQGCVLVGEREVANVTTGDENMCVKEDEILVNTLLGQAKETFVVTSDFSIKEPVRKVIASDSQVSVKDVESGVNFVSVTGEVITKLLYLTENDRFETSYITENFKEEVELEGVTRESVCEAVACIKRGSAKCEVDTTEKGVNVKVSVPVEVVVTAYAQKSVVVAVDVYSTDCDLQLTTSSFEMTKQCQGEVFESKIDGTLTLDENQPRVDKIMFVGGSNLNLTNSYIKDGEIFVEGVTKTNVIYLNDETNSLNSVEIVVPFVVSDKTECDDNAKVCVSAILTDVDVAVKKGREFFFDAKVKVRSQCDCDEYGAVISNVEQGGQLPERECAIELVFAKSGQSAWDIAKAVNVREEIITLQNPDMAFPLAQDENIVVFYQKQ